MRAIDDQIQFSQDATTLWVPLHREHHHWKRLKDSGKLRGCDSQALDVATKQKAWLELLRRQHQSSQRSHGAATLEDLIDFFRTRTSLLRQGHTNNQKLTAARQTFEDARTRYANDCLLHREPIPKTSTDAAFEALDLPITVGGETILPDPAPGFTLAGCGILSLAVGAVLAGGLASTGVAVLEGGAVGSAWEAAFLGLRLGVP
jgi:hypothetical protein